MIFIIIMFWFCQKSTNWQKHGPRCLYSTFFFAFMSKSILSDTKTRTALIAEVQIPSKQNVPTNCHCFANFSVCCPKDYSHLVFEQPQFVGFISVRWYFSLAPLNFWENFSGCKVDGDISLKQPYTFVCVFSPKPLKLQAKLFCHFIAFSSPLDWSIKPTTCQL